MKRISIGTLLTAYFTLSTLGNLTLADDQESNSYMPVELGNETTTVVRSDGTELGFVFEVAMTNSDILPKVTIRSDEKEICQLAFIDPAGSSELVTSGTRLFYYDIYIKTTVLADSGDCKITVDRGISLPPIVIDYFYAID